MAAKREAKWTWCCILTGIVDESYGLCVDFVVRVHILRSFRIEGPHFRFEEAVFFERNWIFSLTNPFYSK